MATATTLLKTVSKTELSNSHGYQVQSTCITTIDSKISSTVMQMVNMRSAIATAMTSPLSVKIVLSEMVTEEATLAAMKVFKKNTLKRP